MSTFPTVTVGVIGGSGLYQIDGLANAREIEIATPFGDPSDHVVVGDLAGVTVAFLPRHGRGHRIGPSEINYRANVFALKSLGARWLISVSAVGSMREDVHPLDVLVPDQIFDRTIREPRSFFTDGIVAHVGLAEPFCPELRDRLVAAAGEAIQHVHGAGRHGVPSVHASGTYICIEGPQFSTKAESRIYRQWGVDVIGMTAMPEARLAREAELSYATLAMVTDYDVWHESGATVSVEQVMANLAKNTEVAKEALRRVLATLPLECSSGCANALANSIVTAPDRIPPLTRQRVELLAGKYLPPPSA